MIDAFLDQIARHAAAGRLGIGTDHLEGLSALFLELDVDEPVFQGGAIDGLEVLLARQIDDGGFIVFQRQVLREYISPEGIETAVMIRGPTASHFEAVFLDQVQWPQQAVKAADDSELVLGMGKVAGIPPLSAQGAVNLSMKGIYRGARIARMHRTAPFGMSFGRLLRELPADVHGLHELIGLEGGERTHEHCSLCGKVRLARTGIHGQSLIPEGLRRGEQNAHGAAKLKHAMCVMPYFAAMISKSLPVLFACAAILMTPDSRAQDCPDGQSPFEMRVHTDGWGYELYWELVPEGEACGTNTLYWGGNAAGVGCSGDGTEGAEEGSYASNATFIMDTLCGVPGEVLTLHHVDSYGDGGTYFEVYANGVLTHSYAGTGSGNVWNLDPFELFGPAYDSPCGAVEVVVDGPMVVVSNDSCTAAYGEPGGPNFPGVYSCQINGAWCEGAVTGSAWLQFTATSGNCRVSACTDTTDFDTQIALWKADDCGDFSTYNLVGANDDLPGGCGPGAYYASALWTGCLDSGATYLIQVDGWADARGTAGITVETDGQPEEFTTVTGGLACALGKEGVPNGTIVLNPIGAGSDFTAAWIGPDGFSAEGQQISGLYGGTYSAVIVTNCGTAFTQSVTLTEPDPIVLDIDLTQPGCPELPNGAAVLAASGGTEPYTINWTGPAGNVGSGPIAEELQEGSYSVVLEDANGCTQELSFILEAQDDAFSFSLGADTTICEDEQLVLAAPAGLDYIWSNGSTDQFIILNGTELGPGTYPITVEASNEFGCSHADAIFVTVFDCTLGIGNLDDEQGVWAFPNPASPGTSWTVVMDHQASDWDGTWILSDPLGREVRSGRATVSATGMRMEVDAAGLPSGHYVWRAEGTATTLRLQLN